MSCFPSPVDSCGATTTVPPTTSGRNISATEMSNESVLTAKKRSPAVKPGSLANEERRFEALTAIPVAVEDEGLRLRLEGGRERTVAFDRIDAVSVAVVHGLGQKPVALVDLLLNWMTPCNETLRLVRLRGDRFDPRQLVSVDADHPAEALRALVELLLARSEAVPLPDELSARGCPFAVFESLEHYQRSVLMVEGVAGEDSPDKPAD